MVLDRSPEFFGGTFVNTNQPSGISHSLSIRQVHFRFKSCLVVFFFYSNFNTTFYKQTEETLTRRPYLGLHCLTMAHEMDAMRIWVMQNGII